MGKRNEQGLQKVLYSCSYVPVEIIMAAGLQPKRMIPKPRPSDADAYMHPNTCHYVKSLLASALNGNASQAAGIVIANSCDGMRRLHDIWKEYVQSIPAIFLDVPKKKDEDSIDFFVAELGRLAGNLEKHCGGKAATVENLEEAISVHNNVRLLMEEVFRLQKDPNSGACGTSVFNLCLEGAHSSPAEFAGKLRDFISDPGEEKGTDKMPRIVLTGNVVHQPELIELIENAGGRVVVLDICTGTKQYDTLVKENTADPMRALAERYLLKTPCARMKGIEERFERIKDLTVNSTADGIIYTSVKFCDLYLYDAPSMQARCEQAGIPFLFLENDYAWIGLGQMRTRVEAFLAMVEGRRAKRHV